MITSFDRFNMTRLIDIANSTDSIVEYYTNSMMDKEDFISHHKSMISNLNGDDPIIDDYINAIDNIINLVQTT